eukprot:12131326-Prorocentrum_lima.AAC.1
MTSSLVGSEMCIRDSFICRSVTSTLWDAIHEVKQDEGSKLQLQLDTPVSYTHLTLPTICSV